MRPSILIVTGHYIPGHKAGGPLRSVVNLIDHLRDEFSFSVLTTDRDLGDDSPYSGVVCDRWITVDGVQVRYCSPGNLGLRSLVRAISEIPHDLLYLNSFFSPHLTIKPLIARRFGLLPRCPVILAPRGEFSKGAIALKSTKKKSYISLGQRVGLFRDLIWQASTDYEAADIRSTMGQSALEIRVALNLPPATSGEAPTHTFRRPGDPLRVVFLSRICPKKNLDFALDVLMGVDFPIVFTIYGPEEDPTYVSHCRERARRLPSNVRVLWAGALMPKYVPEALAAQDLFFLPTHGENFGHVISESLAVGTPVLLSDATPWRGLEALGVGHDLPLEDVDGFRSALERHAAMGPPELFALRSRVAEYWCATNQSEVGVHAHRDLFLGALSSNRN